MALGLKEFIVLVLIGSTADATRVGHILVADAGSSHTSFFLYNWTVLEEGETAETVDQCCGLKMKQVPFECDIPYTINSVATAHSTVDSCLNYAVGNLSQKQRFVSETPFYLRATAGLRIVNITNPILATSILNTIRNISSTKGFFNSDSNITSSTAAILTGEEEGAFGWGTANYLHHTIHNVANTGSVAALDLGGASTQITFIPANVNDSDTQLKLYEQDIELYAHSYLCYGQNEAMKRRQLLLLAGQKTKNETGLYPTILDPCTAANFNTTITPAMLTKWTTDPCLVGYLDEIDVNKTYTLVGVSPNEVDGVSCRDNIHLLFDDVPNDFNFNAQTAQPELPSTQIYAFSAYYYTISGIYANSSAPCGNSCSRTLAQIETKTNEICSLSYAQLLTFPSFTRKFVTGYCANAHYVQALLNNYGIQSDNTNLVFAGKLDGVDVGWAIGLALNESKYLPSQPVKMKLTTPAPPAPDNKGSKPLPIGLIIVLGVIVPLVLGATFFYIRTRLKTKNSSAILISEASEFREAMGMDDDDALLAVNSLDTEPSVERPPPTASHIYE